MRDSNVGNSGIEGNCGVIHNKKSEQVEYRIYIRMEASDHKVLDATVVKIFAAIKSENLNVLGPIPLPVKSKLFVVRRAPNIYKGSFERFCYVVARRLLIITAVSNVDKLRFIGNLAIPHLVNIRITLNKR